MRPIIKTDADIIGGWGLVPALDGDLATVTPNPTDPMTPTATTDQQTQTAATTAIVQQTLLPPPPPPNACITADGHSFSQAFYIWLLKLQQRVGGFSASPTDDAAVLAYDPYPRPTEPSHDLSFDTSPHPTPFMEWQVDPSPRPTNPEDPWPAPDVRQWVLAQHYLTSVVGYVPSTRTISTTAPLTGGGDLSADRTLAMAAASSGVNGYLTSTDWASFTAKAELPTTTAVASATLTAGQWVNFHNVAGAKNCRPADMTDATKPAQGFVLAGFASAATATVYLYGINTVIPVGAYAAADVGKPVFLSTAGGTTLTPPTTTGNLLQQVGWVDTVGATVTVNFTNSSGIVRA